MRKLLQCSTFTAAMPGLVRGAAGDDKKDWVANASRGQQLAKRICASCHAIGPDHKGAVVAGVPSSQGLTKLPNGRITGTLIVPHKPMPNMQLTRNEIADIIAYIIDLRRKEAGKPPINNRPGQKPNYPSPS